MDPSAHHPALFLIQTGIKLILSCFKIDWELIWKSDVDTKNVSKLI